jgi:hypothetical protein
MTTMVQRSLSTLLGTPWVRVGSAGAVAVAALVGFLPGPGMGTSIADASGCPAGMASIDGKFCIDRYEASTEEGEVLASGKFKVSKKHSPYKPVAGLTVKAVSIKGRVPQGYIDRDEAETACENAGKRLCTDDEWIEACKGKNPTKYPYGDDHEDGACNDSGVSSFNLLYGPGNNQPPEASAYTRENMNDERLNEMEGTVAPSGKFSKCKNSYGVFDMVGNLHEWTASGGGTFRGGYYLDTHINGDGCDYRTTAHDHLYHDYSTGFRCCYGGDEQKKVDAAKKKAREEKASKDDKSEAHVTEASKSGGGDVEKSRGKKSDKKKGKKSKRKKTEE